MEPSLSVGTATFLFLFIRMPTPNTKGMGRREKHEMQMNQLSLFAQSALSPDGLEYCPEFVSPPEERALLEHIVELELHPFQFGTYQGKRRVISFGRAYDFSRHRLEAARCPPSWLSLYIERAEGLSIAKNGKIAQVLITEYQPEAGIGWHRDKKPFDVIMGLSLGAACPFRFRRKIGSRWERFTLNVEPRSLYVMRGAARTSWEHSIPPRSQARYSITFRTLA